MRPHDGGLMLSADIDPDNLEVVHGGPLDVKNKSSLLNRHLEKIRTDKNGPTTQGD